MPAIVALGFDADPSDSGGPPSFPAPLRREDLPGLIGMLDESIDREGHAIALYPEWAAEPTLQRLKTVRSVLSSGRLASFGTSLPPLAAGVFASVATALAQYVPSPGVLLSALPRIEGELLVMACLRGVRRLRHPRPGAGQRLASLWPGRRYLACVSPTPAVSRVRRRGAPPVEPKPDLKVAVASRDGDIGWVRDVLIPAMGSPPVVEVGPTEAGPSWWGSRRLVEVVGYPTDLPALAGRVALDADTAICRWCDETVAGDPCPFCGLDERLARAGVSA